MGLPTKSVVIPSGQSLSAAVDVGGANLIGIIFPAAMTGASLAIQVSYDNGVTFYNLYDQQGNLVTIPFTASAVLAGFDAAVSAASYVQFQSIDSSLAPKNEAAARTIGIILK